MEAPVVFLDHGRSFKKLIFNKPAVTLDGAKYFFDGCGVLGGNLVTETGDIARLECLQSLEIDRTFREASGSFCLYIESSDNIRIFPDPLGACLVYTYECEEFAAFSSDLEALVEQLRLRGVKDVAPDPFYLALLLKIGNGAFNYSSFSSIKVLSPRSYIVVHDGGFEVKEYFSLAEEVLSDTPYSECRDLAVNDIFRNLSAIKRSGLVDITSHLTGGFDSRLVAASLSKIGIDRAVSFFCSGPDSATDKVIAYNIGKQEGWVFSSSHGLVGGDKDPYKSLVMGVDYTSGMAVSSPVNGSHYKSRGSLILSGGYGECFRSFYSEKRSLPIDSVWAHQPLLDEELNEKVDSLTGDYLNSLLDMGYSYDQALDVMYVEQRNRYFVGNIATLFSRKTSRFDPLYSINAVVASLKLDPERRKDNFLGFEVMYEMDKGLLEYEFDGDKFGSTVHDFYPVIGKKTFKLSPVDGVSYKAPDNLELLFLGDHRPEEGRSNRTKEKTELAKKLKAPPWQVYNYDLVRSECNSIMQIYKEEICMQGFSLEYASEICLI
ncbi:hypothetical protein, partial [Halomonas sp. 3D7M]|uniref:hypothetical protein n=1 Tax=Halomonas sp. 3D7M TaxID=2742617 RepID=UPI0018678D51